MEIQIRFGNRTKLTKEEINQIITISQKHGNVKVEKWDHRFSAIDIVTFLEVSLGGCVIAALNQTIIQGYIKGLVGESFFKNAGEKHRLLLKNEIEPIINYLKAFYDIFVVKKNTEPESIALVEMIEDCTLYVTLNPSRTSEKLANSLAEALVKTYALISLKLIEVDNPRIIQLYPDFDKQEWDYLFIPTINAFGKYIDKYYCFSENKICNINSANDFIEKFKITDIDEYKLIISPKKL